jgi:hypothetical protein
MQKPKWKHFYWYRVICETLDGRGIFEGITAIGGLMIAIILGLKLGYTRPEEWRELIFICVVSSVGGAILGFLIRALFLTPAKMHKTLENKSRQEIEEKNRQIEDMQDHIKDLWAQLQDLELVRDNAERRTQVKNTLADYLRTLDNRILKIKSMVALDYVKTMGHGAMDAESTNLIKEIRDFLESNIGKTEAALFLSTTDFSIPPYSEQKAPDPKANLKFLHQWVIDLLSNYAIQLKEIIKALK